MSVRLFIGNLPYAASEADLREHLSSVGVPTQIVLPTDRETGRPRGFAFVDYADRAVAVLEVVVVAPLERIEDGSFVRLKNLVVGYTLPSSFADRLGYRSARLYVQGQNLWTKTDYSGFDPEVHYGGQSSISRGTDFYTLPQARTISIGFNLGF